MKEKNIPVSNLYTSIVAVLMLLIASKVLTLRLSQVISHNAYFLNDWKIFSVLLIFLLLGGFLSKGIKHVSMREFLLVSFALLIFSTQWWVTINSSGIANKETVIQILLRYYGVYLICLIIFLKLNNINLRLLLNIVIIFIFINSLLGICQFIFRDPIVETMYNGEPIVNSIYYLSGISSSYTWLYDLGAQVRAFGLVDSGLTLGLLVVFALSISFSNFSYLKEGMKVGKVNRAKFIFNIVTIIVLVTSLYMTLTRNMYLTFANLLLYYFLFAAFKQQGVKVIKIVFLLEWIAGLFYVFLSNSLYEMLSRGFPNLNIETFNSRVQTYSRLADLNTSNTLLSNLFGRGIMPSENWVIDNDILSIVSHIGILPYIMMQIILIWIIFKGLNYMSSKGTTEPNSCYIRGLIIFLMTYPMAATLNYVSYIYFWVALITSFLLFNKDVKNEENSLIKH